MNFEITVYAAQLHVSDIRPHVEGQMQCLSAEFIVGRKIWGSVGSTAKTVVALYSCTLWETLISRLKEGC